VHAAVVETESFGDALALVVTGAGTNGIDAAAIALGLGVEFRVAIHLTGVEASSSRAPTRRARQSML